MKLFEPRCCVSCGVTYIPSGPAQKRCPSCALAVQRERVRTANQAARLKAGRNVGAGRGAHNTPGDKHPQWKGGERKFGQVLAPAYWRKTRWCERCSEDLLEAPPHMRCVHHKDHNRKNNAESNFELLCKRCHQVEHECWKNLPGQGE